MDLISVVLIVVTTIVCAIYYVRRQYSLWKDVGAAFVKPTFPLGNTGELGDKKRMNQLMKEFYDAHRDQPLVGFYLMMSPVCLAIDLDFIKQILVKDFHVFQDRGMFFNERADPLSAHLFSIEGEKWRALRSKLSPTFTSGKMKLMFPLVMEVADRLLQQLHRMMVDDDNEIRSQDILARYTTDVIASCAFGMDSDSIRNPESMFREMGRREIEEPRFNNFCMFLLVNFRKIGVWLNLRNTRDDVDAFFRQLVRDAIVIREAEGQQRNDFMNLLINMKRRDGEEASMTTLSFNEIAAQAFVFYMAGFETSSTLLTFCTFELAKNLNIQEKLRTHIRDVLEQYDGKFTYESMMEMKYLEQILNETLRMYPPLTDIFRVANQTYKVPNTDVVIPKGMRVIISNYAIHHDPDIYPHPQVFDPDRFAECEIQKRHPMAFLPFGEGPRNCIGLRFGLMQARIGLATIVLNFKFTLSPQTKAIEFDPKNSRLQSKHPIYLNLERL